MLRDVACVNTPNVRHVYVNVYKTMTNHTEWAIQNQELRLQCNQCFTDCDVNLPNETKARIWANQKTNL